MNAYTALTIINVAICGAVGIAYWVAQSPWPLVGLLFLLQAKSTSNTERE